MDLAMKTGTYSDLIGLVILCNPCPIAIETAYAHLKHMVASELLNLSFDIMKHCIHLLPIPSKDIHLQYQLFEVLFRKLESFEHFLT